MKFREYYILQEANVYNLNDLISVLNFFLNRKTVVGSIKRDKLIQDWFHTQFIKWYCSPEDEFIKCPNVVDDHSTALTTHKYRIDQPKWASKSGVVDFNFLPSNLQSWMDHTFDYFCQLSDLELSKIHKEPVSVIRQKVMQWDEHLKKQMLNKAKDLKENVDYEIIKQYEDGFKWIRLESLKAYEDEGDQMGHCVKTYFDGGRSGTSIWSLRDQKMQSHITMEIYFVPSHDNWYSGRGNVTVPESETVQQIKGKENKAPIEEYWKYAKDIIKEKRLEVEEDGGNIGMIQSNNRPGGAQRYGFYYFPSDYNTI